MVTLLAAVPLLLGTTAAAAAVASPAAAAVASPAGVASPPPASGPCGTATAAPGYKHVIWVWMENHSYNTIIGSSQAPYINALAKHCGLATNYHNISHPSLPNYISATSGLGYTSIAKFDRDCNPVPGCTTKAKSIFAQGETWKAYEESMPANCGKPNSGEYAVRHNPPPYYTTLKGCAKLYVPSSQLTRDL